MSRRVQLHLVPSRLMSEKGEDGLIRFPRRAREYFGFSNNMVVVGKGSYEATLQVKHAYKEDIRKLAEMLREGKLSEQDAISVGFVTQAVQKRINRKDGADLWVSDGIGRITIGADPEFGLITNEGLLQRGADVLPHEGRFGSDGPSAEVRPAPSQDHLVVVKRIGDILAKPPAAAESFKWLGGATYRDKYRVYWFGGHIHLGRPSQLKAENARPVYERIATVLDSLLALPMCRFDTPEPYQRRNGCQHHYGKAGDIRDDYPEKNRFEYRVLSGLWLVHPALARVAMGTAKAVAETAYNRLADAKFDPDFALAPASKKGLLKSFGLRNTRNVGALINRAQPSEVTPEHIQVWEKQVRSLDFFDDYATELNALIALAKEPPTAFELDLRKNWHNKQPLLPQASAEVQKALEAVEER